MATSKKGGYIILDFKGANPPFDDEGVVIDGIYNACENAIKTNKPVLVINLDLSNDINCFTYLQKFKRSNSEYICFSVLDTSNCVLRYVEVTTDDMVSWVEL